LRVLIFFILNLVIITGRLQAQSGQSLVLNGCTDYLEIQEDDALDFGEALSIECWIRPNCTDGNKIILGKEWCMGQFAYYLSVVGGRIRWSFQERGGCNPAHYFDSQDIVIEPDIFTHVAVSHSLTDLKIFINGDQIDLDGSNAVFSSIHNSTEPLRLGAYKNIDESISNFYSGLIDELRIWNIELTEDIVRSRYNSELSGNEEGLGAYYQMNGTDIGENLIIPNTATVNPRLVAITTGFSVSSPYCIIPNNYNDAQLLEETMISICGQEDRILTINENLNYKNILWSTTETTESITVSEDGDYSVSAETELCKMLEWNFSIFSDEQTITIDTSVCEGNTIIFRGEQIGANESRTFTISSLTGCDSTIIINVNQLEKIDLVID